MKHRITALTMGAVMALSIPGIAAAQTDVATDVAPTDRVTVDQTTDQARDRATDRATDRHRDIEAVKERALAAIERRLEALARASEFVASNGHIDTNHAAILQADYDQASRGLEKLAEDIASAETGEELRTLIPKIAEDYRVFLVILPKSHLVVASDTMQDVAERAGAFAERLQDVIDRAAEAGWDVTEAQALLDEAEALVAEAAAVSEPVADDVIHLSAKDWPDPARAELEAGKQALTTARETFRQARDTFHAAVEALRNANPHDGGIG